MAKVGLLIFQTWQTCIKILQKRHFPLKEKREISGGHLWIKFQCQIQNAETGILNKHLWLPQTIVIVEQVLVDIFFHKFLLYGIPLLKWFFEKIF